MSSFPLARPVFRALSLTAISVLLVSISLAWASRQQAGSPSSKSARSHSSSVLFAEKGGITPEAATIIVNSLSDVANGSEGLCTLREAITAANNNATSGAVAGECAAGSSSGSDIIDLTGVTGTINLTGALPSISSSMTITGPGSGQLTVTRNTGGDYRIFTISSSVVAISGLTISNGKTADGAVGVDASDGGGILNSGTLTLTNIVLSGNRAGAGGSATPGAFGANGGNGGGIANTADLTMTNCSVTGSNAGAGGPSSSVGGRGGSGGGIYSSGSLTLTNCTITDNQAGNGGSGTSGNPGNGGGIYCSQFASGDNHFTNVTVRNNFSGNGVGNSVGGNGGGIDIENQSLSSTITNSTIDSNHSGTSATGTEHGKGAGIFAVGLVTVMGSAITNNAGIASGGGIQFPLGTYKIFNTTISSNSSPSGAGLMIGVGSPAVLVNSTLAGNTGGIALNSEGSLSVRNTIIAANDATKADVNGNFTSQGHNLIGNPGSSSGFTNGVNGDQVGTTGSPLNPQLGPLANNGGPTMTHALLASSPVREAGDNCVTDVTHCGDGNIPQMTTDQRGAPRLIDFDSNGTATVDVGAYELQNFEITNTNDSGAGSLRQAIAGANASAIASTIWSNIPASDPNCLGGVCTITLTSGELVISHAMSIQGPRANLLTVSGNNASRVFKIVVGNRGIVTVSGLTITSGKVIGDHGGGISNANTGNLNINGCAIIGNQGSAGGGIDNDTTGTVTVTNSLISGNTSDGGGGGIFDRTSGPINVINSTLSGNTARGGGGIAVQGLATVKIVNSTISGNSALNAGAGGGLGLAPTVTVLRNTIIAGNLGTGGSADDISGQVDSSSSFNLIGTGGSGGLTNGVNNNMVGVADPRLGPLADNGGPTRTMALLPGSPAMDAGDSCVTDAAHCGDASFTQLTTDQRGTGFSRSVDAATDSDSAAALDIGAFEAQVSVEDSADKTISEDTQLQFTFNIGVGANVTSVTATSSNTTLVPNNAANIDISGSGSTRTLTINPLANGNGSSTITVTVNGNNSQSATDTFLLTVSPVNDVPSFTKGPNQTVNEDAGAQRVANWATAISRGPADEAGQALTFQVTNNTNTALFSVAPAISSTGTLTYTPAADASGSATITVKLKDNGGTANGGVDTSASQTFTISVNSVNDAPSFTKGANQTVNEDAGGQTVTGWATNISAGPADESSQTLTFQITSNSNAALFSTAPAVNSSGTLTYTPAADANGSATITISLKDNGGTANGGVDTSAGQTFTITVNAVNDVPSFTKGTDQTVNEDSGIQNIANWATAISAGPANESSQTLSFTVTNNTNAALFSSAPSVSSTGTLSFTPSANANGSATITIVVKDNGGTANGGVDTSAPQTFTITVNPVNDAPTFTKGADQTVNNNAGAQTLANWASSISAGPANESSQTLTFQIIGNTNPSLFSAAPALSSSGTLTYTPSSSAGGTATITINLKDNGGTANGGVDTSASQTFTITVTAAGGVVNFASSTGNTTENSGSTTVNVVRTGDTSKAVNVNYATNGDSGLPCSTVNGVASPKCDFTAALGTLTFAAGETSKPITILISQDSFVEGPEVITLTLSNPTNNAALGTPGSMSVTIADDASEPPTNVIDDAGMFVRMHYHDFLNREADQSGLNFWTGQMTNCGSSDLLVCRVNVSGAFFLSIEFQQTGYLVERFYKSAYGDATGTSIIGGSHQLSVPVVRFDEFLKDTQRIGQGVIVLAPGWEQALENNKQAYAGEFVATTRFVNAFPTTMTPAEFVDKLNQNAGNVLSANERTTAINLFSGAANSSNTTARANAVRQVAEDQDLYNAEFRRAFVLTQYFGYLRRNPNDAPESNLDYSGYEFWLGKLNQFNGDYVAAEMVKAFISSDEYRKRFGP
jgi:CSLREA domain-containing protein